MQSLLSLHPGGPDQLTFRTDAPRPDPAPDQVRIRVHAAALNMPDLLIIEDKYQMRPPRPFAPGSEVAGTIDALGAEVTGLEVGQRVMAVTSYGGLAEYACAPASRVSALPPEMPFDDASALLVTYGTAWHALQQRGALAAGDSLLVLGASGGVGLAAIELGRVLGLRVIAGASSETKLAVARAAGANDGLVYPTGPLDRPTQKALAQQIKALAGPDGLTAVFDPVGGDLVDPAFRALGWEGRYLVIGFAAGIAALPMNLPLLKGADVRGVFWADSIDRDPEGHQRAVAELCALYAEGRIRPRIQARFDLRDGAEALALLASRKATGKIVVEV